MTITIKQNRKGEITFTAKGRKSGVDLRKFVEGFVQPKCKACGLPLGANDAACESCEQVQGA